MSSKIIRDLLATQWPAFLPLLPLKDAHNKNSDYVAGLPSEWGALLFPIAEERRISLGTPACFRETGDVVIRVYVKSGIGQARALTLVEAVKAAWIGYSGLSGQLQVLAVSPPHDLGDGESLGDWYGVQVSLSYFYDTYK